MVTLSSESFATGNWLASWQRIPCVGVIATQIFGCDQWNERHLSSSVMVRQAYSHVGSHA